jgi:chromosome segregation ATPase
MEDNGTILLDVQMDDLINSLRELKRQYDENTAAMKKLKEQGEENSDEYIKLANDNKVLRGEMRGVESQIQNEIKAERAQEKSLVQLRAQLANLQKQYDAMSGDQRMSQAGTALQQKIKALSDEVLGLEGNTGRWQRNVGNYKSALEGLAGSFGKAGLGAGGLGKAINALQSGNPVIAGVTAAVAALTAGIKRLTEEFKENEKAAMEMHETNAAVEVQTYANKRAWNALADWFNGVWRKTVDQLVASEYQVYGVMDRISNFFGGNANTAENFARQNILLRKVAEAENKLTKDTREWGVQEAKIRNEIADLRQKTYDKENYNAQQRAEMLDQIEQKELYISKQRENLARREYEINKARSAMAENSAEENDRLYASQKKVIDANTEFLEKQGNINRRRSQASKEIENETKKNNGLAASVKKVREKLEEIQIDTYDEALKEAAKGNKELADSITEVANRLGLLKGEMADAELQGLDSMADAAKEVSDSVEDAPDKMAEFAAAFARNADTIQETASGIADSFGSISDIYKTMAEDETKSEEERAEAARKAKTWAGLQIAANAGTAVAKGVSSAMDQPFPANLGAIATTLAAVLAAIAQAKALAAESHAGGGVVGNAFMGATMGADNTVINARKGELVINAEQQRRLYDIANGGAPSSIAASLAAALRNMPSPTLVYSEFSDFQRGIINLDESQKLR